MRRVAGARAASTAALMRSASVSVSTTWSASFAMMAAVRWVMAVASVSLLLYAVINDR